MGAPSSTLTAPSQCCMLFSFAPSRAPELRSVRQTQEGDKKLPRSIRQCRPGTQLWARVLAEETWHAPPIWTFNGLLPLASLLSPSWLWKLCCHKYCFLLKSVISVKPNLVQRCPREKHNLSGLVKVSTRPGFGFVGNRLAPSNGLTFLTADTQCCTSAPNATGVWRCRLQQVTFHLPSKIMTNVNQTSLIEQALLASFCPFYPPFFNSHNNAIQQSSLSRCLCPLISWYSPPGGPALKPDESSEKAWWLCLIAIQFRTTWQPSPRRWAAPKLQNGVGECWGAPGAVQAQCSHTAPSATRY